jgi:hypothetical protein
MIPSAAAAGPSVRSCSIWSAIDADEMRDLVEDA